MKIFKSFFQQSLNNSEHAVFQDDKKKIVGLIHLIVFSTSIIGGTVMYFYDMNSFLSLFLLGSVSFLGWLVNRAGHPRSSAVILIAALLFTIQFNIFAGFGIHDVAIIAWPAFIFFSGLLFGWQVIPYVTGLIMLLAVVTKLVPSAQFFSNYSDTGDLIVMLLILLAFSLIAISLLRINEHLLWGLQRSEERFQAIYNSINDAIIIHDSQTGAILDINEKMAEMFGYTRSEALLLGNVIAISSGIPPYTQEIALEWIKKTITRGTQHFEWQAKDKCGRLFWVDINMKLATIANQPQVLVSVRDITERKLAEAAMRESEERLKEAQRIALIGNWELNLDNNNLTWSDEIYRIFEIDPTKFGASYAAFLDAIHPADREMVDQAFTTSLETQSSYAIDHRLLMPDGRVKYVLERCESFFAADGHPLRSVGTVQDITERKCAEETLLSLKRSIDQSFGGIARADMHGTTVFANKAWARMHGYEVDEIIGQPLSIFHTQAQMTSEVNPYNQLVIEYGAYATEIGHVRKDGTTFITWMETTLVKDSQQQPIELIASAIDITKRKHAERALRESEEKYRRLFDNASLGIFQSSLAGQIISINTAFVHMLGYDSPEDAIQNIQNVATDLFADPNRWSEIIRLMADNPDLRTFENVYRRKDGSTFIGQLNVTPVRDAAGQLVRTEGLVEDITERKQAEAKILAALEEKETLLREVHHRVKNNLQAMIALMEMQAGLIPDEATRLFLKELEGQARTMALVYEQLYQSINLARVQMAPYLQQLTYYISETFGGRRMVQLSLEAGSVTLDVSQAMPCGLIVNELFTNIFKHAFPPGFDGQPMVQIALELDGENYHLTVSDNGVGLPPDHDWQASRSLGLRLVNLWATHQLGGTLNVSANPGATYTITFPNPQGLLRETAGGSA